MLEEEGVEFESSDGDGRWKIREIFFIGEGKQLSDDLTSSKRQKTANGNQVVKDEVTTSNILETIEVNATIPQNDISEEKLKQEILSILGKRAPGKTC
ncbi:hypothetical protein ACHAXS_011580 [Conticribra weissflogii]